MGVNMGGSFLLGWVIWRGVGKLAVGFCDVLEDRAQMVGIPPCLDPLPGLPPFRKHEWGKGFVLTKWGRAPYHG